MTNGITRREWMAASAAATLTAPALQAAMPKPLGAQLYTVRNILMKEPDRVFKTLAEIGYTEVEGNRADLVQLVSKIRQYGLKPISCHIETPLITGKWEPYPDLKRLTLDDAIDSAKKVGVEYFTLAYISPGARGGEDFFGAPRI
ncbi:MAG TPA: hypothetical protein VFT60_10945 [Bryobacteraceae bacterium]|nr:hypothetical protein [Bryobacteraceae bacterium]